MKEVKLIKGFINSLSDEQLSQYFKDYVDSTQCKERHTDIACDEAEAYDQDVPK